MTNTLTVSLTSTSTSTLTSTPRPTVNADTIRNLPIDKHIKDRFNLHYITFNGPLRELLEVTSLDYIDKLTIAFELVANDIKLELLKRAINTHINFPEYRKIYNAINSNVKHFSNFDHAIIKTLLETDDSEGANDIYSLNHSLFYFNEVTKAILHEEQSDLFHINLECQLSLYNLMKIVTDEKAEQVKHVELLRELLR